MKVFYNGVTLSRVYTERWNETVKYDDTGVNVLGSTITMSFRASVLRDNEDGSTPPVSPWPTVPPNVVPTNYQGISSGVGGEIKTDASDKLKLMLRNLQTPRCALIVYDDITGRPVFEAYPAPLPGTDPYAGHEDVKRNIDVNNGPKPQNVQVNAIVNEYYEITFEIEVTKIRCLQGETNPSGTWDTIDPSTGVVISNRCWTDESIDDNFYTTRTFNGKLTISTNSVSVHSFRHLFYPPLEVGFRRSSVRFSESQDGLSLNYVVVDKQIRNAAPYPATQYAGSVTYSLINSYKEIVDIQLSLMGAPFTPRKVLFDLARLVVYNKIKSFTKEQRYANGQYGRNSILVTKLEISENFGDPPTVTIRANAIMYVDTSKVTSASSKPTSTSQTNELEVNDSVDSSSINSTFTSGALSSLGAESVIGYEISQSFTSSEGKDLIVSDAYHQWTYDRKLSSNPNPNGYNIYDVYDNTDSEVTNEPEHSAFVFIKALATTPCATDNRGLTVYCGEPLDSPGVEQPESSTKDVSTVVTKEPYTKIQDQPETNLTTQTINCPYTHYKSHVIYSTIYNRIVKPRYFTAFNPVLSGDSDDNGAFDPPVIVDVAPAEGRYFVTIEAEKLNGLPELPDPEEILTVTTLGETSGGLPSASEGSRDKYPPENEIEASTNTTVDSWISNRYKRTDKPMKFYCLKNSVQITEPQTTLSGNGTLYSVLATYEYATSRPLRKGDEVRLLLNPIVTQEACYYPRVEQDRTYIADRSNSLVIYDGTQLNHMDPDEASGIVTETTGSESETENSNP